MRHRSLPHSSRVPRGLARIWALNPLGACTHPTRAEAESLSGKPTRDRAATERGGRAQRMMLVTSLILSGACSNQAPTTPHLRPRSMDSDSESSPPRVWIGRFQSSATVEIWREPRPKVSFTASGEFELVSGRPGCSAAWRPEASSGAGLALWQAAAQDATVCGVMTLDYKLDIVEEHWSRTIVGSPVYDATPTYYVLGTEIVNNGATTGFLLSFHPMETAVDCGRFGRMPGCPMNLRQCERDERTGEVACKEEILHRGWISTIPSPVPFLGPTHVRANDGASVREALFSGELSGNPQTVGEMFLSIHRLDDECANEGLVRCSGGYLRTCHRTEGSRLEWGESRPCSDGRCADGSSCRDCADECPSPGVVVCEGNASARWCTRDPISSCLVWSRRSCDDGRGCTEDICSPAYGCQSRSVCGAHEVCAVDGCVSRGCESGAECDDGNPCTVDECIDSTCSHWADPSVQLPKIPQPQSPADCVEAWCDGPWLNYRANDDEIPEQGPSNDCLREICQGGEIRRIADNSEVECKGCEIDAECDDRSICTLNRCDRDRKVCVFPPDPATNLPNLPPQRSPHDCWQEVCEAGVFGRRYSDDEIPPQDPADCLGSKCERGRTFTYVDSSEAGNIQQWPDDCRLYYCGGGVMEDGSHPSGHESILYFYVDETESLKQAPDDCLYFYCEDGEIISEPAPREPGCGG